MGKLFIVFFIILAAFYYFAPDTARAVPGQTNLVFQQTSSALTATPNVQVCVMNAGMVRDFKSSGVPIQNIVCDTITGYFLGKKLTVPLTGAQVFTFTVKQDTLFNHDGHATNGLTIQSGTFWGESVR